MQFKALVVAVVAAAVGANAASCVSPEDRFGVLSATSSSSLKPGKVSYQQQQSFPLSIADHPSPPQSFTVRTDLACAASSGVGAKYLDYYVVLTAGKDAQPPVLLARREVGAGAASDAFTAQVRSMPLFLAPWKLMCALRLCGFCSCRTRSGRRARRATRSRSRRRTR
jgi:hypothetical protein